MGLVQAGFLAGLLAIAVPIIIHLVMGRRGRRVDLGTLRFLKIVLRQNIRRRRLKRWLLLALRIAGVGLLAFLFARPYLLAEPPKTGERLVVVLIDRSASMGLQTSRGRPLDRAVAEAEKIVSRCGEGTRLELACFDHAVHPMGRSDSQPQEQMDLDTSPEAALADLASTETLCGATDYGAALAWAHDLLVQSKRPRKELHVFTDLQRSGLDRTPAGPLPGDAEVHLIDLGQTYPENAAVTRVTPSKLSSRPGERITVTATVLNAGQFPLEEVPVVLRLTSAGQRQTMHEAVNLDAGATVTVPFELPELTEGLWQGEVSVEARDDLPFDNRRCVAVMVASPLPVLLVDGDRGAVPAAAETYFLEAAIRLAPPGDLYADTPFEPRRLVYDSAAGLPDLADTRLVVLANVASLSPADARRLAGFISRGGGLIVFTGDRVTADGYRSLEAAGISAGRITGIQTATSLPWRLRSWDREHPVFGAFGDPEYGDLRRLAFRAYTHLEPAGEARVLARFQDRRPALLEREHGGGKVLWFTSACDRQWGDWPRSRLFVPLVHQMLGYLGGLADGGPVRNVVIGQNEWGERLPVPGVYDRQRFWEVVNVDPRESETDRASRREFADRFGLVLRADEETTEAGSGAQKAAVAELRPDEIWHWVILVLAAVLLAEAFLANRTPA